MPAFSWRLPSAARSRCPLSGNKVIIDKLGEAGKHLNEDNLSNWRLGGYQDHLKAQAINDRARTQTEAAADLVRDTGHLDPSKLRQACGEIALLHYLETLMDNGEQLARESLKKNPAKFITLINACCNMSNANIAVEKRKLLRPQAPTSVPNATRPIDAALRDSTTPSLKETDQA